MVQITPGTETPLRVTFREDSIALESEESFRLRLSTDDPVPTGDNFFFVNTLDINIKDSEGTDIQGFCLCSTILSVHAIPVYIESLPTL